MTQMLPYILPLLLGRTFNLDTMEIGVDIFPKEVIDNPQRIESPVSETHYKVVDNTVESRDLLDVSGSFSLKVKSGVFKAGASGEYLSDKYNRENTVEVAIKATYQTVTEQIPTDAKPFDLWKSQGNALGTHFVRSITYGGELIAAIRMVCKNTRDKQRIKGALEVGGRIEIFDLGIEVEGEYMKEVAKSVDSTQIKIFSSVPLSKAPNDMKTLNETLDNFSDDLKRFNGGRGIPLKMELWPLSLLDPSMAGKLQNRVLQANLEDFELKFDDLTNTKSAISDWLKTMKKPLTNEQEQKVGDFWAQIQKTVLPFYEVIGNLDMTGSSDQLKPANNAYGLSIPGAYYKKFLLLRQEIAKDQGAWKLSRGNGATFIHWGTTECPEGSEKMSNGTVVGPRGYGGGANFMCLPQNPSFGTPPSNLKEAAILQDTSFQFPNQDSYKIACSTCRLGARGAVQTFVGRVQCPEEWDYVYDGIVMSGSGNMISTEHMCLDKKTDNRRTGSSSSALVPDWAFEAGSDEKQFLFTCVVCAK